MLTMLQNLSDAKIVNTEASGNVQRIYTAVILASFSLTEAFAQGNVKISSIHGYRPMTGSALTGNGRRARTNELSRPDCCNYGADEDIL